MSISLQIINNFVPPKACLAYTTQLWSNSPLGIQPFIKELIENVGLIYNKAKNNVISAINVEMLNVYWEIGNYIVEFE